MKKLAVDLQDQAGQAIEHEIPLTFEVYGNLGRSHAPFMTGYAAFSGDESPYLPKSK